MALRHIRFNVRYEADRESAMSSVAIECRYCKSLSDVSLNRLKHALSIRCNLCSALSSISEFDRNALVLRPLEGSVIVAKLK